MARSTRLGRRVPFVQQMQDADCSAACLAMVLGHHGRKVRLGTVQEAVGVDRNGTDGAALLRAAESFGLRGRGLSLEFDEIDQLGPAAILHWGFNHFVVFERCTRAGVVLLDPASGRRTVSWARFRRSFTGIAFEFEVVAEYRQESAEPSRFWSQLRRMVDLRVLGRVLATSLMLRLFALSLPLLTSLVVDRVVPRGDLDLLVAIVGGLAIMVVFELVAALLRGHLLLQLRGRLDVELSLGFLDHLTSLPYAFFQRRSQGDLMMRVNSHATIREILTANTLAALLDGPFVLTYLLIIALVSPVFGALVAVLVVIQVVIFACSRRAYRELTAQELETRARAQSYLVHLIAGIETLKAQGAERSAVEQWSNSFIEEVNVSLVRGRVAALVEAIRAAARSLAPLAILSFGALLVTRGSLSLGAMLGLAALAGGLLAPLDSLVNGALQLQLLRGFVDRIDDVLRVDPERRPDQAARTPQLRGGITLERVGFGYGEGSSVLEDIDVDIRPGACVAIVGHSGSGKSTLAKLMLGLYTPRTGVIRYDGHDFAELEPRALRRQLGIVMQKPHLFGGSIRSNIGLGVAEAGLDRIVDAAKRARIHATIEAMPMGYETLIGEDGDSLSGGERQRLALARALITRPAILLLDEATSALDTKLEQEVMDELAAQRCTRIVIAHRLSTVVHADLILVMHAGRIVERGTHPELIALRGRYFELVEAQT
ncbi:peptidase domain-containing ABC transporter [Nannocystaceae bacterium ST9]